MPGLVVRVENGHLRSRLVVYKVCEIVGRIGVSAGCSLAHMCIVVKESRFCDPVAVRVYSSRVGVSVQAEPTAVATVTGLFSVRLGITHEHIT